MTSTNQDSYVYAGLVLETTVLSQASTAGSNANIGSFSGAQSLNEWLGPMKEAPSNKGAFLISATPPDGKQQGVGYVEGRGIGSRSVKVLPIGRRLLLQERGTQPGTLEYNCGHAKIQRLRKRLETFPFHDGDSFVANHLICGWVR